MACLTGLLMAGSLAIAAGTRPQRASELRMQTLNVSDDLYLLTGGGGTSLVLVTDAGVVLVDSKLPGWGAAVREVVQGITDKPITTIIDTHAHDDHAGANSEYPGRVEIVAHDRTKARLTTPSIRSFADRLSLFEGSNRIELYYFGRAHTDGDVVVVFPEKRVAYLGDLFPAKAVPVIDTARGGSGLAFPDTLARAVAALNGVTRVIPAHGPPLTGSPVRGVPTLRDLQEYADFVKEFVAAAQAAKEAGKSAADAPATLALPERFKGYDMSNAAATVQAMYAELSAR